MLRIKQCTLWISIKCEKMFVCKITVIFYSISIAGKYPRRPLYSGYYEEYEFFSHYVYFQPKHIFLV